MFDGVDFRVHRYALPTAFLLLTYPSEWDVIIRYQQSTYSGHVWLLEGNGWAGSAEAPDAAHGLLAVSDDFIAEQAEGSVENDTVEPRALKAPLRLKASVSATNPLMVEVEVVAEQEVVVEAEEENNVVVKEAESAKARVFDVQQRIIFRLDNVLQIKSLPCARKVLLGPLDKGLHVMQASRDGDATPTWSNQVVLRIGHRDDHTDRLVGSGNEPGDGSADPNPYADAGADADADADADAASRC